ncbi:MAG TPA: LLM class flavin-dependent oxidoreductase [Pelagibacteraceae bacterium]|jgi:alkanesulfonate monooxygenase SsuD/methylene tetrahydromethanopterin reductase-like flavin-dependent oxidoreductase (luciferase family)|nr:LLM class flavin-dependent oxidoreductase [Pelagibacteraceae bacterium]
MKIGYFCNITNWKKKPYTEILDNARDIAVYCDKNNWNSIWFTEHHFNHEGMESSPNPLMICTDVAARTKQIRLGQACNVITFWNPIRLAEDIAALDHLSKGRVEVGIGRGVYGREAVHMNVEADLKDQAKNKRLFQETLTIMKKAWTEKFFKHKGEFYTYPSPNFVWQHDMSPPNEDFMDLKTNQIKKISVIPQPYQKPHPPIWQVVDSASSIEWAAKNGINCIMWIPTVKTLKKRFEIYKNAKSETKKKDIPMGEGISLVRDMFVAETMEDAKKLAGEQMVNYMRWVCHWRGLGNHMDPGEELPQTKGKLDLLNYDFLHKRNMLFGTPDYVVEKIKELQTELNLQNLLVWSSIPGIKHEDAMRSVKLFNDEVIPKINLAKTVVKQAS